MILYWYNMKAVWQQTKYGGIAQLGERLNGIQEVSGSIPLISTKNLRNLRISEVFLILRHKNIAFYPHFAELPDTYLTTNWTI